MFSPSYRYDALHILCHLDGGEDPDAQKRANRYSHFHSLWHMKAHDVPGPRETNTSRRAGTAARKTAPQYDYKGRLLFFGSLSIWLYTTPEVWVLTTGDGV
jgi:hypothetical protein